MERLTIQERLENKSIWEPNSGCHIFVGCWCSTKYGMIWHNGKLTGAHRVSWELTNGNIPEGLYVCHKCDVRSCINPRHLFVGTQTDNMQDSLKKNRRPSSYNVLRKPLTKEQKEIIEKEAEKYWNQNSNSFPSKATSQTRFS